MNDKNQCQDAKCQNADKISNKIIKVTPILKLLNIQKNKNWKDVKCILKVCNLSNNEWKGKK